MKMFNRDSIIVIPLLLLIFSWSNIAFAASSIDLGTAGNFAVLGGSTITNTGSTIINGDLGLSPGTSVTGFPPGIVTGTQHINNAVAAQAQTDLVTAYNNASGQGGAVTVSGDLGGMTLTPGVYNSSSSLGLTGTLTLDGQGDPNAVFVFQVGSALTTASASSINLVNGAQACNVFWQVSSSATFGTNSSFVGTVMTLSSVTVTTGASINGRVLARNGAVTLDTSPINKPSCAAVVVAATVAATVTATSTPVTAIATSTPVTPAATTTPVVVEVIASTTPYVYQTPFVPATVPTVLAVAPSFPDTGFAPQEKSAHSITLILAGILFLLSTSLFVTLKKRTI